ncbi:MAG: outer membrane lipoprotein-sorting protein [SAR86 cluster bacterium]|uniref:Outer membrane lipoprotein-sorting protein n=1 Tax=SAR86 cluster bacterium TaxID=2030880 RepID=A0A2A4MQB7_9GAMM|nr:MAG: outer membrane lipoprotein-sorting protein [SAR86 cluster bacterium]
MKNLATILTSLSFTLVAMQYANNAEAIEVQEIVKQTNHNILYQGDDGKTKIDMRIIDSQGRERTRQLTMLRKNLDDDDGLQKYYLYFSKPADINKMVFMAWKNVNQDDDRWLYLPALDLVRRIAASDERTSFVGSHFFYEDVSGRNIDEDVHELIEETDEHYVVKSVPVDASSVEFEYYINWVDKQTFLPIKAEYYNQQERVYRTYSVLKVEVIEGYHTIVQSQMEDTLTGAKTILDFSEIDYDIDIPENIFSERYLRRAPRKYLR